MAALSRGQITIVDLNDAKSLNLYLGSNQPTTQIFNKENGSYVPNYVSSPFLVITPELFISGVATNVISQIKATPVWKINGSSNLTSFGAVAATTGNYALTIKKNLVDVSQLKIECEVIYVDPVTTVETKTKALITFTKTENAGQLIVAIAYAPLGTIFKQGGAAALKAHCDLWRGSEIDATKVAYKWFKLKNDGTWTELTATTNFGVTGYTTNEITIPSSAVLNFETFKCEIKDTDNASGTYNTVVADIISLADMTDPYKIECVAPAGDKIVNGQGSIVVSAEVWQRGEKIADSTADSKFTFTWRKFNKDGVLDSAWGTSGVKTGRTLTVTSADVVVKSTFVVEITAK